MTEEVKRIELIKGDWDAITLGQFQEIYKVFKNPNADPYEKEFAVLNVIYGIADEDELDEETLRRLRASIGFLHSLPITPKLTRVLNTNGKRYWLELDLEKLPGVSAYSIMKYAPKTEEEIIEQIHYLLARAVRPMKKVFGIWKKGQHNQADIELYCEDLKQVPFSQVASFFNYLSVATMIMAKDIVNKNKKIIIEAAMAKGFTKEQVEEWIRQLKKL